MKNKYIILILSAILLLAACKVDLSFGDGDNSANDKPIDEGTATEEESPTDSGGDEEAVVEVNGFENASPTDLNGVFENMKIAAATIESIDINAHSLTITTIGGVPHSEENEMINQIILDPFIQHIEQTAISGDTEDGDMYFTPDIMYMDTKSDGWIKMDNILGEMAVANIIQEVQINHFINYQDLFKLDESNEYYTITYIGTEEQFTDVIHTAEMVPETLAGLLETANELLEITGELEMKIDKETFLIVQQHYIMNSKVTGVLDMEIMDELISVMEYNTVDSITIPQDIIDNAVEMSMPSFE